MEAPDGVGRGTRWATTGAVGISVLLPVMELWRVALAEPFRGLVVATGVVAVCLPLHVRHVRYALHGRRAPHAGWSLGAMAALMGVAAAAVTVSWALMLASLAVSVLLVIRPPWSLVLFALTLGAVHLEGATASGDQLTAGTSVYFVLSVAFRVVCLFVVVRLVAHVRELDEARRAVARRAVEHQRAQTALQLTRSLGPDLQLLGEHAAQLPPPTDAGAPSRITDLVREARQILADVRSIVSRTRGATSQRQLADAGRLLRGGAAVGEASVHPADSPALRLVGSRGRARALLALAHAVVLGILVSHAAGIGFAAPLPVWSLPALGTVVVVELRLALLTARSAALSRAPAWYALAVAAALIGRAVSPDDFQFSGCLIFLGAAGAMAFRGRARMAAVTAPVLLYYVTGLTELLLFEPRSAVVLWYLLYLACVTALGVGSLYASARLVQAAGALATARSMIAEQAVDHENRRFARDLHDTLVQSLSAIALTGDLALRLLPRDPAAARREVDHLRHLARGLADDARRVGAAQRTVTLAEEARVAARLLRAAGVRADISLDAPQLSAEADALLGWAVREAATNVVRHSNATRCAISVGREAGHVGLLVVNDGAASPPAAAGARSGGGNGLAGLAERVRALRGSMSADDAEAGSFRLRVWVPEGAA